MTKWHLMIVGLLALGAAVLVGLNWTTGGRTADGKTEIEPVKTKTQQASTEPEDARSDLHAELEARCKKHVSKRVGDDVEKEEIEDACACAAEEIHDEFEEELPAMLKSGKAEPETEDRIDEIIEDCVQSAGIELQ